MAYKKRIENEPEVMIEDNNTEINEEQTSQDCIVNCLRNERVIARFIPRKSSLVMAEKHVQSGGLNENAVYTFTVPMTNSGFVKVLTNAEEKFLEEAMGLESGALNIHKRQNNFWSSSTDNPINRVQLHKQDNYFDLSIPEDYIKVKILLANKNVICPSLQDWESEPKASYKFMLIRDSEEVSNAKSQMDKIQRCYMEYGKYSTNIPVLRHIIETADGVQTAPNSKLEFLQVRINSIIQKNQSTFLNIVDDPYMLTKVLIKQAVEEGVIARRGTHHYLRDGNLPLCGNDEEPTLSIAAKFLNLPKNQALKLSIEEKLKLAK